MLKEYFKQYIKINRQITDSSVNHYITALNSINTLLQKYDFPVKDIYKTYAIDELMLVKEFLWYNTEFLNKDSIGNNMYSVAFKHFYRFALEDGEFYRNKIELMDIKMPKAKQATRNQSTWERNQILISQVIESEGFCCQVNLNHATFKSRLTGQQYMEGHHLIQMKHQNYFDCGIDIYANIISVCPVCHRLFHYGEIEEKTNILKDIFLKRRKRLETSGIKISADEFLQLI